MLDTLTLGDKEIIRGRWLTQRDSRLEPAYCVDCLADLPDTGYPGWWEHRCEIPEPAPRPVVQHKTRTWQSPQAIPGRFHKRGSRMFERAATAICSCGWSQTWDSRDMARAAAREHRAHDGA